MDSDWFSATDRETERLRIEAYAGRQREKLPPNQPVNRPGYERRKSPDWFEIMARLAVLQARINDGEETYATWPLGFRILLLTWPKLMPYSIAERRVMPRDQVESARDALGQMIDFPGNSFLWMLSKTSIDYPGGFEVPRISIKPRNKAERTKHSNQRETEAKQERTDEAIGRAVIAEYRKYEAGRRSLELAKKAIAALPKVDGIFVKGYDNVEKQYLRFRKAAFSRGYADSRAFMCEYLNEPWPDDQIWLDDFPPT